ncbi:hypothetical protein Goshw_029991, partial [Gossypium schwendimanii]|nr:hypothetical protein [Gossypium schwendimanii]
NRYVPNALTAEVLASTQALRFAQELGFWKVEVEGDSLVGATELLTSWPKRGFTGNVMPGGWRTARW